MSKAEINTKKSFKFPHAYVIIMILIIFAVALTWLIPAGEFERIKDEATGKTIVVADKFSRIENTPVSFLDIPKKIVESFNNSSDIMFLVLIVGGAFQVIIATGMFQAMTGRIAQILAGKENIFIPAIMSIFAFTCMTQGVNTFIGFAPIGVMIARSMGYDAIVGVGMIMLGGAIGFSTGTFNPYTTGIAQAIAELPMFSGLGLRVVSLIVFLIITNIYLIKYAKKVKANPELSVVYELEQEEKNMVSSTGSVAKIEPRHYAVLIVVFACFALLVYGGARWEWDLNDNAALFIWMAILGGLAYGFSPSRISKEFVKGAQKLVFGAIIVGMARTISIVLSDGKILDTVVFYMAKALGMVPVALQGPAMFLMHIIINCFIVSGSGQATVTMPIMIPVADIIGMSRQTAVLAFNFGDGLCNYILPHSSALIGFLAAANIPYDKWMRFMGKLFVIWFFTGSAILLLAHMIGYGPF